MFQPWRERRDDNRSSEWPRGSPVNNILAITTLLFDRRAIKRFWTEISLMHRHGHFSIIIFVAYFE